MHCERTEIAGLPAYVGDPSGPPAAALVFNVGQASETLRRRGLTHLVEHLVLALQSRLGGVDGYVDLLSTVLVVEDAPDRVARRVHEVAAALHDPPVERLDTERQVLSVEAAGGAASVEAALLTLWYGARGPGLAAYPELGLRDAEPRHVVEHARTWFVHGNAALAVSGPVTGLDDLALPPGPRRAAPDPVELPQPVLPAEVPEEGAPLALGAPLPDSPATRALAAVLERRAWETLRHERGMAYDVRCRALEVGGGRRLLVLHTDVAERDAGTAAAALVDEVRRTAERGVEPDELAAVVDELERLVDRAPPIAMLARAAQAELLVRRPRTPDQALAQLREVRGAEIAEAAGQLASRMLLSCPAGTSSGRFEVREARLGPPLAGRVYEPRLMARHMAPGKVVVGDEGVSALIDDDTAVSVRFDDCVAAVREIDGGLTLIGGSGQSVSIDPGDLKAGGDAVERAERALGEELIAGLDERVRRLERGAPRGLRPAMVGEAPALLAPRLGSDEALLHAAEASRGLHSGVLAVTDRRLLFVAKLLSEHVEEISLARVRRFTTRRHPLWPALTVEHDGETTRFLFLTTARLGEAAQALAGAMDSRAG